MIFNNIKWVIITQYWLLVTTMWLAYCLCFLLINMMPINDLKLAFQFKNYLHQNIAANKRCHTVPYTTTLNAYYMFQLEKKSMVMIKLQ